MFVKKKIKKNKKIKKIKKKNVQPRESISMYTSIYLSVIETAKKTGKIRMLGGKMIMKK